MKTLFLVLAVFGLAACATPYQAPGLTGGVTATPTGADRFRIEADLNGFSTPEMVSDYMLLKGAEIAHDLGARGFTIDNSQQKTTTSTGYTGGYSYTVNGRQMYMPLTQYTVQSPSGVMEITLVRDVDPEGKFVDAAATIAEIGPRVRRPHRAS